LQKIIRWEPGNGTSYEVLLTKTEGFGGHGPDIWLAVGPWAERPRAMYVREGDTLSYHYVSDKYGVGLHDASVVALMIAPHVNGKATTLKNVFEHYPSAPAGAPIAIEIP
jgi:hypothetical protein